MWVSIFILGFTLAAAGYWARYVVLTLLSRTDHLLAAQVGEANRFEFPQVREVILAGYDAQVSGSLAQALISDFLVLTYLLRYAATLNVGHLTAAERILVADFHLMRATHAFSKRLWPHVARRSLLEMSEIVVHFAGVMGERMRQFSAVQ